MEPPVVAAVAIPDSRGRGMLTLMRRVASAPLVSWSWCVVCAGRGCCWWGALRSFLGTGSAPSSLLRGGRGCDRDGGSGTRPAGKQGSCCQDLVVAWFPWRVFRKLSVGRVGDSSVGARGVRMHKFRFLRFL